MDCQNPMASPATTACRPCVHSHMSFTSASWPCQPSFLALSFFALFALPTFFARLFGLCLCQIGSMSKFVANLLGGSIQLGHRLGECNYPLLRHPYREGDGVVLKPDRPVAPIDRCYQVGCALGHSQSDLGGKSWFYVLSLPPGLPDQTLARKVAFCRCGQHGNPRLPHSVRSGGYACPDPGQVYDQADFTNSRQRRCNTPIAKFVANQVSRTSRAAVASRGHIALHAS